MELSAKNRREKWSLEKKNYNDIEWMKVETYSGYKWNKQKRNLKKKMTKKNRKRSSFLCTNFDYRPTKKNLKSKSTKNV